ncbi:MAG: metal-dependent hydrolase [Chloroflexi bacterium]|nr:metal-dependent hydrolase [Chloroflexota bacterium]
MTRGTHQVGAFAAALGALVLAQQVAASSPPEQEATDLAFIISTFLGLAGPQGQIPWTAVIVYIFAAILGGVAPDLDKAKSLSGRILSEALLGGHRHLSHSLLGAGLAAVLALVALSLLAPLLSLPAGLLLLGFLAGYLSHLFLDGLTHEGVPLLFPAGAYFGLPPFAGLRLRTGSLAEQFVVMPALLGLIAWLGFSKGSLLASLWR